jgi:SAM-dependent methyltransferase
MLAEVFLEKGNAVVAIEPNADMRARMHATLGAGQHKPEIIDAAAEATTLPDASIDMIGVGRAFHWFDQPRALQEFRRILKPGGWVALVAIDRSRDTTDPLLLEQVAAYERLLAESGTDYARVLSGYRTHDKMEAFFDGEIHQAQLPGSRELDWPTFRGHTMSLSVSPGTDHPGHEAFQRELRRYFETYAADGMLTIPTTCWITAAGFAAK